MSGIMNGIEPEVVMITGASAGVGRATALAFAKRRAHLGLIARGLPGLESLKKEVEALGGKALVLQCDVSDPDSVELSAEKLEQAFGPITVWVNNAMTTIFAPFKQIEPKEFKRATDVTYLGAVYGTMTALRRMLSRDKGTIVQVGSALAYRSIPLQAPYCGAKHAILGFTASLRTELLHDGSHVHITMVHLPAMNTPQFEWCRSRLPRHPQPVPPIFEPEVAAEAIYWAAHHRRREVFVGGSTVKAIFGNKVMPSALDYYLANTGYEAQQTQDPIAPDRPDNLFEPVNTDYGTHGLFAGRSANFSLEAWSTIHRNAITMVAAGAAVLAWAVLGRKGHSKHRFNRYL
jgi:short-subunit dehydrogenase